MEIILSFFASIGIVLLTMRICDYFFYRKPLQKMPLIVDLRGKTKKHSIEVMEMIAGVRKTSIGKATVTELIILHSQEEIKKEFIEDLMKEFNLNGVILERYYDFFLF